MDKITKARNKTLILKASNRTIKITQELLVCNRREEVNKTLCTSWTVPKTNYLKKELLGFMLMPNLFFLYLKGSNIIIL
jgi:hypothetical protein